MIPSRQNHSWLLYVFLILLLHSPGIGGTTITIANRCSEPIWPMIVDNSNTEKRSEYEVVQVGRSMAFQRESGWNGRVWGRTGCVFNNSGSIASCVTGDTTAMMPATLVEFGLMSSKSMPNFYDVSLVNGFNLPVVVKPITTIYGSGSRCEAAGCVDDLNQSCPTELRTKGGAACQSPCSVFKTPEYCCTQAACGPTDYSQVFKRVCPRAFSYPQDNVTSTFSCDDAAAQYLITFCPPSFDSLLGMPPAGSPNTFRNPQQTKPGMPPAYPPNTFSSNPQQTKPGKIRAKEIITIVSVGISGVIIISIIICCFLKRRRHSQNGPKRKCKRDVENLLLQHGSLAPKRYRYSEIKKMTKSLSDKLGQGGFGSVYKGMLPDGRLVAVKILSEIMDSNGGEFINEVASISRTSHVNIVSLLGFCYEGNKSALVYEYMPNKSLDKFLVGHDGDGSMDLKKLYKIAVGIAKGLEYLHTGCTTRIVHFDIKPQNILLDDDLCPKISDFGLAKLCKKKQSVLSVLGTRGTAGYIAPEVFSRNFGVVSHKSDVYSYGMMLLEMAGAKKIVGTQAIQMQSSEDYFPDKIYEQVIIDVTSNLNDQSMMIEEEEDRRRKMLLIGFWCIQTIPTDRPSMSKVVEMLEGSLESLQIPPKPFLFSTVIPHQQTSSSFSANVEIDNLAQD